MSEWRDHSTGGEATDQTLLKECGPRRSATFHDWPEPVHAKLDELVDAANNEGVETHRYEVAAAIISFTELDPAALAGIVMLYRKAKIGDILPLPPEE